MGAGLRQKTSRVKANCTEKARQPLCGTENSCSGVKIKRQPITPAKQRKQPGAASSAVISLTEFYRNQNYFLEDKFTTYHSRLNTEKEKGAIVKLP